MAAPVSVVMEDIIYQTGGSSEEGICASWQQTPLEVPFLIRAEHSIGQQVRDEIIIARRSIEHKKEMCLRGKNMYLVLLCGVLPNPPCLFRATGAST